MSERDASRRLIYRHTLLVRVAHWVNVLCLAVLLASGLQIFNAHPALYWGNQSDFENPVLSMTAEPGSDDQPVGVTTIFKQRFETTGSLCRWPMVPPCDCGWSVSSATRWPSTSCGSRRWRP